MDPTITTPQLSAPDRAHMPPKTGPGSRASLACLPCRSRHIRCDARKPACGRCAAEAKTCVYAKSRRGGLDRAALAALAARQKASPPTTTTTTMMMTPTPTATTMLPTTTTSSSESKWRASRSSQHRTSDVSVTPPPTDGDDAPPPLPPTLRLGQTPAHPVLGHANANALTHDDYSTILSSGSDKTQRKMTPEPSVRASTGSPSLPDLQSLEISGNSLIDRYYEYFHRCHPLALPRRYFAKLMQDTTRHAESKPLISVMKYIGSLYITAAHHLPQKEMLSSQLENMAAAAISEAVLAVDASTPGPSSDSAVWLLIQSHLIYSIGLYWQGQGPRARTHLDAAIRMALDYRMYSREYALEYGRGDPVLTESLRRTWWQIYVVDASLAAVRRQVDFTTRSLPVTADLPCEEDEYESGIIPPPQTLRDFDAREFAPDDTQFSSFAYLIGAMQSMSAATSRCHAIMGGTPGFDPSSRSPKVFEEVDALINGWMLLVPESKRAMMNKNGEPDELIFYAYMGLHASTVGLHRRFSDCQFNPLEGVSSCSSANMATTQRLGFVDSSPFKRIHTAKCIEAAESQIRLLAFFARPCSHSPFTVCMLTTGTLSLLSACRFILQGEKIAIARDQIRASIGYHKAMSGMWKQARVNLDEICQIARQVLFTDGVADTVAEEASSGQVAADSDMNQLTGSTFAGTEFPAAFGDESSLSMDGLPAWNADGMQAPLDISSWWMYPESPTHWGPVPIQRIL